MTRRLIPALLPVILALVFAASASAAPVLQTTPTPTPTPTPGPQNQPVSSFHVDNEQEPPWAVPIFPTWGTGTPASTLYAATPLHGTGYPNQVATATAQLDQFTAPLAAISTPVAGVVNAGPTQTAGDIDTGIDPAGGGDISFSTIGTMVEDGVSDAASTARQFIIQLSGLATYSPWLAALPVIAFLPMVIGMFLLIIVFIIRAGKWLWKFATDFLTFIGVWVRG